MQDKIEALKREFNEKLENLKQEFLNASLKESMWVKYINKNDKWINHPTNIFRIKRLSVGTVNSAKGIGFLHPHADSWNISGEASHKTECFQEAKDFEISNHLFTEAKKIGYKKDIIVLNRDNMRYYEDKITSDNNYTFDKEKDTLSIGSTLIYKKGIWSEILEDEKIMIDKYEVVFKVTSYLSTSYMSTFIDNKEFKKEFWEAAKTVSENYNAQIMIGDFKQYLVPIDTINKILTKLKIAKLNNL